MKIDWYSKGQDPNLLEDLLYEDIVIGKMDNDIPNMNSFHNCTFSEFIEYSKLDKIFPITDNDRNKHVFLSYGKAYYKKDYLNSHYYDDPITIVFNTDDIIEKATLILPFDGGIINDLYLSQNNKGNFFTGYGFKNFHLPKSITRINAFIKIMFGSVENYFECNVNLKDNKILNCKIKHINKLIKNENHLFNKLALFFNNFVKYFEKEYSKDQKRLVKTSSHLINTIEFFLPEIDKLKSTAINIHLESTTLANIKMKQSAKDVYKRIKKNDEGDIHLKSKKGKKVFVVQVGSLAKTVKLGKVDVASTWENHLVIINKYYKKKYNGIIRIS